MEYFAFILRIEVEIILKIIIFPNFDIFVIKLKSVFAFSCREQTTCNNFLTLWIKQKIKFLIIKIIINFKNVLYSYMDIINLKQFSIWWGCLFTIISHITLSLNRDQCESSYCFIFSSIHRKRHLPPFQYPSGIILQRKHLLISVGYSRKSINESETGKK